jgi:SNF2 family DNA or RNA helicase
MQYSEAHNLCVYDTPEPSQITRYIPRAKRLDDSHVAVPCDIREMQMMRFLGYEALSPILTQYSWPRNTKKIPFPFDHQRHMAAFLTLHPRAFNLSDIGTGKTLGTLWALDYMMDQGLIKKALILSPLSTLGTVWEDEIRLNFMGKRTCRVLHADRSKRIAMLGGPEDIFIINHDGLGIGTVRGKGKNKHVLKIGELAQLVKDNPDINCVIVDEGSVYKDATTTRYKVLSRVTRDKPYFWWLTGSPTPNAPTDGWAQARIVNPHYTEGLVSFRERTMVRITDFRWLPKKGSDKIVAEILSPAICYDREQCLQLPPMTVTTREVELTKSQKDAIKQFKQKLKIELSTGAAITAINEASLRTKLIQIICGAIYGEGGEAFALDSKPRLDVLKEYIEQTKDKLLIFAPLTSVINLLYSELTKAGYSVERITGDVGSAKRTEVFRSFQSTDKPHIIVADPRTMAHGLTLTAAATIIWYGPTDQAEIYQQANGRINRPGQTKNTLVVRIVAHPLEKEIYRRLDDRESMQGSVLDIIKGE